MFDPMAARKPPQLNVASVAEASATPPTMGSRDRTIGTVGVSPRKSAESNTEKKGSIACTHIPSQISFYHARAARERGYDMC